MMLRSLLLATLLTTTAAAQPATVTPGTSGNLVVLSLLDTDGAPLIGVGATVQVSAAPDWVAPHAPELVASPEETLVRLPFDVMASAPAGREGQLQVEVVAPGGEVIGATAVRLVVAPPRAVRAGATVAEPYAWSCGLRAVRAGSGPRLARRV